MARCVGQKSLYLSQSHEPNSFRAGGSRYIPSVSSPYQPGLGLEKQEIRIHHRGRQFFAFRTVLKGNSVAVHLIDQRMNKLDHQPRQCVASLPLGFDNTDLSGQGKQSALAVAKPCWTHCEPPRVRLFATGGYKHLQLFQQCG